MRDENDVFPGKKILTLHDLAARSACKEREPYTLHLAK
jgi:hypothetical protein